MWASRLSRPCARAAGGRCAEEGKRQILGPDGRRCDADLEELLRVGHADWGQACDLLDDLFAPAERIDQPQDIQADGVVGRDRDLVGDRGNLSPRLVVQPLPVGAHGDRAERSEGSLSLTAICQLARDPREVADRGRARPRALGYLQVERGHRVFGRRKADLLRRSEQTHAVARTAELARQVACEVEPLCAALWFDGQLCGALEG